MAEVKITYETLFDLLRREKSREELQELDKSFYSDVLVYLKGKQSLLGNKGSQAEMFGASESEKVKIQIQNIKKMIKEIFEKRERKVMLLATNKSKTGSTLTNTTAMLEEEKVFFENFLKVLNQNREQVLKPIIFFENNKGLKTEAISEPTMESEPIVEQMQSQPELEPEQKVSFDTEVQSDTEQSVPEPVQEPEPIPEPEVGIKTSQPTDEYDIKVKVKFTAEIPKFIGKRLEEYGPYKEGDTAELPQIIANILINKNRAEKME
ncbi:MAG: hypothetical protein ABIB43_00825 [archaeon]